MFISVEINYFFINITLTVAGSSMMSEELDTDSARDRNDNEEKFDAQMRQQMLKKTKLGIFHTRK